MPTYGTPERQPRLPNLPMSPLARPSPPFQERHKVLVSVPSSSSGVGKAMMVGFHSAVDAKFFAASQGKGTTIEELRRRSGPRGGAGGGGGSSGGGGGGSSSTRPPASPAELAMDVVPANTVTREGPHKGFASSKKIGRRHGEARGGVASGGGKGGGAGGGEGDSADHRTDSTRAAGAVEGAPLGALGALGDSVLFIFVTFVHYPILIGKSIPA